MGTGDTARDSVSAGALHRPLLGPAPAVGSAMKLCVVCGKPTKGAHPFTKFCSRKCRKFSWDNCFREMALAALGGACVHCGFSDYRALQIDHVLGGGTQKRKRHNSRTAYHKFVAQNTHAGEYQLLCSNCNWIKRYENKEV